MAYSDIALLTTDNDFRARINACVSGEGELNPPNWTSAHIWQMASAPGFGDAYASAIVGGINRPGNDQSVISDGQILSAVQDVRADDPPAATRDDGTIAP